ncbi:histidine kinase [Bernardetia sp. MNP-M8]|uniref:sensor histidine kinase n=1 Tax=Bernardetia sp. MNP-M8 TaxID=3127470 RepID=UPI0030D61594
MKKSVVYIVHTAFWVLYFLLLLLIIAAATKGFSSNIPFGYIAKVGFSFVVIPSVITFYLCYFYLFTKYIKTKKIVSSLVYAILFSVGSALVGGLFLSLLFGLDMMFKGGISSFLAQLFSMVLIGLLAGVMSIIINGFITWYDEIKLKEELIIKNHQIELALVKAQLDPHFLFNTINNIDALILKDPKIASEYLNKLSDILRFMLFETKAQRIDLSKEIEYIEKYIALQKTRTANESFVHFTLNGNLSNQVIPPMLLISFIENAFKHTANKKIENAITISLNIDDKTIVFECENKYNPKNKIQIEHSGIGNNLIRKRIELLYPQKHNLSIINLNNSYRVTLTLIND